MYTSRRFRSPRRSGFTLVELLVAAALCILIMTILATAFQSGLQTMSTLKSAVSLSEQLRATEDIFRRDLSSQHLEDELGAPVRLSQMPVGGWRAGPDLPRKGYFSIKQPSVPVQLIDSTKPLYDYTTNPPSLQTPSGPTGLSSYPFLAPVAPYDLTTTGKIQRANYPFIWEGIEDGVESYKATDHTISMTAKLSGKTPKDVANTSFPAFRPEMGRAPFSRLDLDQTFGNQLVSQWMEVVYFLRPIYDPASGVTAEYSDPNDPTLPTRQKLQLYSLHRVQRAIAPLPVVLPLPPPASRYPLELNIFREQFPELSIATIKPTFSYPDLANTGVPLPPTFPGYPNGYRGLNPWYDSSTMTSAMVNTPESVTDPLNRTDYLIDWPTFAASGNGPPKFAPLLPTGYQITNPASNNGLLVNPSKFGSDLVLNNVVSMEVRVVTDASGSGVVPRHLPPYLNNNFSPPFGTGISPFAIMPRVYDTHYGGTVGGVLPNSLTGHRLRTVQIKLRVYDIKNNMTRQITITQDV